MGHETSHTSPGFGKNTNGFGIVIVAIVLVSFALFAWNFWKSAAAEESWYRFEKKASTHGEASHDAHGTGHEAPEAAATAAGHDTTTATMHSADTSAKHEGADTTAAKAVHH